MNVSSFLSQDADGLKVGVADLINQWVKGSEDGSRCSSPSKPGVCQNFTLNYQNCMKKCLFLLLSCCTFVNLSADLLSNKFQLCDMKFIQLFLLLSFLLNSTCPITSSSLLYLMTLFNQVLFSVPLCFIIYSTWSSLTEQSVKICLLVAAVASFRDHRSSEGSTSQTFWLSTFYNKPMSINDPLSQIMAKNS